MGRITKFRAPQTRAAEEYDTSGENLATDKEVETRVRKHSSLFHHFRNDNTSFNFDNEGNLAQILVKNENDDVLTQVDFDFVDGDLNKITKEIKDEGQSYVKYEKTFIFDDGTLSSIDNKIT